MLLCHRWSSYLINHSKETWDLSRCGTSAACHKMSTFLFFLAWTFWPRNLSSSGRHVWERDLGRPERRQQKVNCIPMTDQPEKEHFRNMKEVIFFAELTVLWQNFLKLLKIWVQSGQTLQINHLLEGRISEPEDTKTQVSTTFFARTFFEIIPDPTLDLLTKCDPSQTPLKMWGPDKMSSLHRENLYFGPDCVASTGTHNHACARVRTVHSGLTSRPVSAAHWFLRWRAPAGLSAASRSGSLEAERQTWFPAGAPER